MECDKMQIFGGADLKVICNVFNIVAGVAPYAAANCAVRTSTGALETV